MLKLLSKLINSFISIPDKFIFMIPKVIEELRIQYIIDNVNKFAIYNLNQNSVLNAINNKLYNE